MKTRYQFFIYFLFFNIFLSLKLNAQTTPIVPPNFNLVDTRAYGLSNVAVIGNNAYYTTYDTDNKPKLFKSDGTINGTGVFIASLSQANNYLKFLQPGSGVNPYILMWAQDGSGNLGFIPTNGSSFITTSVSGFAPSGLGGNYFIDYNGIAIFGANSSSSQPNIGTQLWRADAAQTQLSTQLIATVNPSASSSSPTLFSPYNFYISNNTVFFNASYYMSGTKYGAELWKTDGTTAGTSLVLDIFPGATSSNPTNFKDVNGTLYFAATGQLSGQELWKSDGTAAGTVMVKDMNFGSGSSTPQFLTNFQNKLYYIAYDNISALWGLYTSDGTAGGTVLVKAFSDGAISGMIAVNNKLVIGGLSTNKQQVNRNYPESLYVSDGTAGGTNLISNLTSITGSSSDYGQGQSSSIYIVGNTMYYYDLQNNNNSAWRSDLTTCGTYGLGPSTLFINQSFVMNGQLFAIAGGREVDPNPNSGTGRIYVGSGLYTHSPLTDVACKAAPTITSFTPTSGAWGTPITITGTNFDPISPGNNVIGLLTTNGPGGTTVTSSTATSITTVFPITGVTGPITVIVDGWPVTSANDFTFTRPSRVPTITSFTPTSGKVGTPVIITGTNFSPSYPGDVTNVYFQNAYTSGGTQVSAEHIISNTTISTYVPDYVATGPISIAVQGVPGDSVISLGNFTIIYGSPPPPPTITSFTPTSGPIGTTVTITGTNFDPTPSNNIVYFNNSQANVIASTATSISAVVPPGYGGQITVKVGSQAALTNTYFTVPPPTITSFTPTSGLIGASVTITGTGFDPNPAGNVVMFNYTTATVTASTNTSITTSVPPGTTTGKILVVVDKSYGVTSSNNFNVPPPSVTTFSPIVGIAGTTVTIIGTNFDVTTPANNVVKFNGTAATVTASTATSLIVTVPSGATSGAITVLVAGQTATSVNSFTITATSIPTAPVATAGTSITSTGFTANWGAVVGATGYFVDISTASNFSSFVSGYNAATASGTSQAVAGLTAGTIYYYRVRATSAGGTSGNSNSITVTTSSSSAPATPVATAGTSITLTSFAANWSAVSGATGYLVDVSTASNFISFVSGYNSASVSGTSLTVTGLTVGTTYYYQVRATSAGGTSGNSNPITVTTSSTTAPAAPVATAGTSITSIGFTANWGAVSGATGYLVDVSTASDFHSFVSGYNSTTESGTSLAVTGLTEGTIYYYQVRAVNGNGASINSNSITVTTSSSSAPAAPVATAGTSITTTGFTANWGSVSGATGYQVDVSTASDFISFVSGYNAATASGTSLAITGLTAGTTYYYQVRATNADGTSGNSNTITVSTSAGVPDIVIQQGSTVIANGDTYDFGNVTLSGNTGDIVFTVSDPGTALLVLNLAGSSLTGANASDFTLDLTNINSGTATVNFAPSGLGTRTAQLSIASNVTSKNPYVINLTGTGVAITAPVATDGTSITSTGFTANWGLVSDATGYLVDVSTANDFSSFVSGYNAVAASNTSLTVTGLTAGTTYFYQVRATNASSTSANSNVITVTTPAQAQAQTITFGTLANVTVGTSQITLTATASSGLAVTYTSSDNTIATVSGSTLTIVGAGSCTITADQAGNSDFSAAAPVSQTFCANPAQPTITLSGANSVSPTLTSSASSGNQWFLDGAAVSGATNSTFSVSQVGTYTVQVSVGTCQSTMSADEVLIVTGDIKSISTTQGINLYPNPARSLINISLENLDANESVNIQVFDMLGHNLQELFAEGGSTVSLDIANYAQGSYLIRATQSGNLFHSRFAKQ